MAFKRQNRLPTNFPEFADLNIVLAQSKQTDNALYQAIQILVNRLSQYKVVNDSELDDRLTEDEGNALYASKFATFITEDDETTSLPESRRLIAGLGISLDVSVDNQMTISAAGVAGTYYDAPLTDGDVDETDLIFADGECVIVQVPNAP